jgi:branched-chain amino acid transport system substrate-binding protein
MVDVAGLTLAFVFVATPALADDTIKIRFIDPLSGGAPRWGVGLKTYQYLATRSAPPVGSSEEGRDRQARQQDNPQESLIQAQKAADQGIELLRETALQWPRPCPTGSANTAMQPRQGDRLSQLRRGRSC